MKCIKYTDGKVSRVTDNIAESLVNSNRAIYIPKSIWKTELRDTKVELPKEVIVVEDLKTEIVEKPKKKRGRPTKKELKSIKNKEKKSE